MTGISAIQSRTAELQSLINSVSPGSSTTTSTTSATVMGTGNTTVGTSATQDTVSDFATTLANAVESGAGSTATSGTSAIPASSLSSVAADGTLRVAGLTVEEFQSADVEAGTGLDFLQRAMTQLGVPYVWGGSSPSGFDCSGLVQYVFNQMGVSVPRVVREQMTVGTEVPSLDQAQPGDLIVTRNGGHIGIYVGGDQMLHAPQPGDSVKIGKIYGDIVTIRRVVPTGEVLSPAAGADPLAEISNLLSGTGTNSSALLAASGLSSGVSGLSGLDVSTFLSATGALSGTGLTSSLSGSSALSALASADLTQLAAQLGVSS